MNRRALILRLMALIRQMPAGGEYQTEILEGMFARMRDPDIWSLALEQGLVEEAPGVETKKEASC